MTARWPNYGSGSSAGSTTVFTSMCTSTLKVHLDLHLQPSCLLRLVASDLFLELESHSVCCLFVVHCCNLPLFHRIVLFTAWPNSEDWEDVLGRA
jgi:hypothetical protein